VKEAGPYIAIAALLITLGGTLYGWATSQGQMQAEVRQLRGEVDRLQQVVVDNDRNFQGMRLEIARWMAAHEDDDQRRSSRETSSPRGRMFDR